MGALPFCAVIKRRIAAPIAKYKIIARIRMASSGVTLSHLPHDVLLTILQQGLGPRELCRLEQLISPSFKTAKYRNLTARRASTQPVAWRSAACRSMPARA